MTIFLWTFSIYAGLIAMTLVQVAGNHDPRIASLLTVLLWLWIAWETLVGFLALFGVIASGVSLSNYKDGKREKLTTDQIEAMVKMHKGGRTFMARMRMRLLHFMEVLIVVALAASGHTVAAVLFALVESWAFVVSWIWNCIAKEAAKVYETPIGSAARVTA